MKSLKKSLMSKNKPLRQVVVPFSGGMDSTVLLHYAATNYDRVHAISFDYGQRHLKELESAVYQINDIRDSDLHGKCKGNVYSHRTIELPFFKDIGQSALLTKTIDVAKAKDVMGDPQTVNYVPFRNLMLLSIACSYAEGVGADTVYHGAAQADSVAGFWDGSQEFLTKINEVTALNRRTRINVEAPLIDKSKAEIIQMGIELGVDFSHTWTCYEGKEESCGECTACALRLKGFIDAGIKDPLNYSKVIPWDTLI
jgi:7-cyano-7-deazaguanine synthase